MKRRAYKYLITAEQRDRLEAEVQRQMEPDQELDPRGHCRVVTQYFDSPERDCYWERVRKMKSRKKVRVRFLEAVSEDGDRVASVGIKAKRGRAGGERGMEVPVEVAERLVAGDLEPLRGMLEEADRGGRIVIHEVADLIERLGHEPAMQIGFDRIAYQTPDQAFRVTFDSDVNCKSGKPGSDPGERGAGGDLLDPEVVVVEVTSMGPVPNWFRDCVQDGGFAKQGFSKYSAAMQKFDPVLKQQLSQSGAAGQ